MTHDFQELNQYTGFLMAICAFAVVCLFFAVGSIGSVIQRFHADYRRVHDLDRRDRFERENPSLEQ
jgi:hypothetical protein